MHSTVHYVCAMLKAYGINQIVASPGVQNAFFNLLCQEDPFFCCHSVIDERSAAYVASGLADESDEPVVITCTEATAGSNYLPAMTECYYRKIPVVAVTFFNDASGELTESPQFLNRKSSLSDVCCLSFTLPTLTDDLSRLKIIECLNAALVAAKYKRLPVHINVPSSCDWQKLTVKSLPQTIAVTNYINRVAFNKVDWSSVKSRKVAIFMGIQSRWDLAQAAPLYKFVQNYGIPVFCEHNSRYLGPNKIMSVRFCGASALSSDLLPDIIIDLGGISADCFAHVLFQRAAVLRVSSQYRFRNHKIPQVWFDMEAPDFFSLFAGVNNFAPDVTYYSRVKEAADGRKLPALPLCTPLICQTLSTLLAKPCSVHLGFLNSYRMANCFEFDDKVQLSCNTGGFGIDGAVSSLAGHSLSDKDRLCIGVIGDLAFICDMNVLSNKELGSNFKLVVINNQGGQEFRNNKGLVNAVGKNVEPLVAAAAAGHHVPSIEGWAVQTGCEYLSVRDKDSLKPKLVELCFGSFDKPVVMEVFTDPKVEQDAFDLLFEHKS